MAGLAVGTQVCTIETGRVGVIIDFYPLEGRRRYVVRFENNEVGFYFRKELEQCKTAAS